MKTKIIINCNNAAFEDGASYEVSRILTELADKIQGHPNFSLGFDVPLRDTNGNEVGYLSLIQ